MYKSKYTFVLMDSEHADTSVLLMKHHAGGAMTEISRGQRGMIRIPADDHMLEQDIEIEVRHHNPAVVGDFGEWLKRVIANGY